MRRGPVSIAVGSLLLAAAAISGFLAASRLVPQRLQGALEHRLSDALETPVTVASARVAWAGGVVLEGSEARAWEEPDGAGLSVERITARVVLPAVALGRLVLDSVVVERATWIADAPPDQPADPRAAVARLDDLSARLRDLSPPARRIEIRDSVLRLRGSPRGDLELRDVDARIERSLLPGRVRTEVSGRLGAEGHLRWNSRKRGDRLRSALDVEDVDLASLRPLVPGLGAAARIGGRVEWRQEGTEPHRLDLALAAEGLQLPARRATPPLPRIELRGRLTAGATQVELSDLRLSDERLELKGSGALSLPVEEPARLRLDVAGTDLPLPDLLAWLRRLQGSERDGPAGERPVVEAGRLSRLALHASAAYDGWRDLMSGRVLAQPGALRLEADLREATLHLESGERLERLSGSLEYAGDTVALREVVADLQGEPLPRLDAEIRGLSHIRASEELRCVTPAPVAPLPGARAFERWLESRASPQGGGEGNEPGDRRAEASRWQRIRLEADWLSHPGLLCGLEQVAAELRPAPAGFEVDLERGVWAGLAVRAQATVETSQPPDEDPLESVDETRALGKGTRAFVGSAHAFVESAQGLVKRSLGGAEAERPRVQLTAELGPPFEPMASHPPREPWARGRFEVEASEIGSWRMRRLRGSFHVEETRLTLEDATLELEPGGELRGGLSLELGDPLRLPFRAGARAEGVDIALLREAVGVEQLPPTGTLHGAAAIEGELREGLSPLASAEGVLSLHGRDGMVRKEMPLLMAIFVAGNPLDPFAGRREIPYNAIDLVARFEGGALRADVMRLDARTLRLVGTARVAVAPPHELQGAVGLFLFPTLDAWIDRVPLLDYVLLGPDRNLVGAYYALRGALDRPEARLIPVKSLAAGPATLVLEGLPGFVRGGLHRIQSILGPEATSNAIDGRPPAGS